MQRLITHLGLSMLFLLSGCAAIKPNFDFTQIASTNKPNEYLACPENYCGPFSAHQIVETYPRAPDVLEKQVRSIIEAMPRTVLKSQDEASRQYTYIQRSFVFRFPDILYLKIIEQGDAQSSLAIYSHAVYGHSDLGVNEKRVKSILSKLAQIQPKA